MTDFSSCIAIAKKGCCIFIMFTISSAGLHAQKSKADSLKQLLAIETIDSHKVKLMWELANVLSISKPDTALLFSQQALYLAKSTKDIEGQSRSLGVLANTFSKIGNYNRALELNIEKLQLEEKRNKPRNLASVLMNIGIIYVFQEEYRKALNYYTQSDSIISKYNITDLKYFSVLNLGDVYNRLAVSDSAYRYFNKSLELANALQDDYFMGVSMTGLGHSYLKIGSHQQSLISYQNAITYLHKANDIETLSEASLGLANLYQHLNKYDSARHYASYSLSIAKKGGFLSKELEASQFLTDHYKKRGNIDSAFAYLNYLHGLNDSLNSRTRIRELQTISSNEQFRQLEIEEDKKLAKKERSQQLQLLFIGILIPGLFLITLLLSRVKIHIKVIRVLGVVSLLFFFEYLTLWLHPTVAALTHHTPVWEILIFVIIGSILIPTHHRLEHWLIHKLIHHRIKDDSNDNDIIIPSEETPILAGINIESADTTPTQLSNKVEEIVTTAPDIPDTNIQKNSN